MTQRTYVSVAIPLLVLALAGCGPRLTPAQRVEKLRLEHEIIPVGSTTVHDAEGNPTLIVDLRVTNKGTEHLPHLTVLVRVHGKDGVEKASRRVTLDLADASPGVGIQVAAKLPGVEAGEDDQVTVQLESNLSPEVLKTFPEYQDVVKMEGAS
ncbi:MAG: hypothetical protein LJE95_11575 [Acidobacteria bacterium]|nr:hypothetical protein [Acidobacteriota bacterium]